MKRLLSRLLSSKRSRKGSALLLILGCVALLTIVILSFFGSARTEFSTSSFYARGANTKLLTQNVVNLVEAQLREGARSVDVQSGLGVAWASQPGMIRTYDTAGNNDPTLAYKYFKLYSSSRMVGNGRFDPATDALPASWSAQPNNYVDLNEPITTPSVTTYPIIDPSAMGSVEGFSYSAAPGVTASSPNQLPMPVQWLYVLQDGTTTVANAPTAGTAVTIPGASLTNPIVGRVAFWTDDETSKVNINTASEGIFWDRPNGSGQAEHGNTYLSNPVFGFGLSLPATAEFQRTAGHPATTSLSAVFGYGIGAIMPKTGLENAALTWPLSTTSYTTFFAPYFSLTPKLQAGASMGGSQLVPLTPAFVNPGYRLYDSVDELTFDPSRTAMYAGPNTALYLTGNGAAPSGRSSISGLTPQVINQRRFFLTAHSRAPEETLFGTPRVSLWPLQAKEQTPIARNAKDNLLAFCSTINGNPYFFQRATWYQYENGYATNGSDVQTNPAIPSSQSATQDFPGPPTSIPQTGVARNENIYAYLQALTGNTIPGFGGTFSAKYPGGLNGSGVPTSDRDEILTEMFDLIRAGVNTYDVGEVGSLLPHYTYTPYKADAAYNEYGQPTGSGSTVPIAIATNGQTHPNTFGLGRTYNIAEVSLVFMASSIDLAGSGAGTLDGATNPAPPSGPSPPNTYPYTFPIPRRISIGQNLPWACEEDYAPSGNVYLYWDPATKKYGTYYMDTDPMTNSPIPCVYTIPRSVPIVPLTIYGPNAAVPLPVFCYWDTVSHVYGSYFEAPAGDTLNAGKLFICNSPGSVVQGTGTVPALLTPASPPTSLPLSSAVTIGDPQTTGVRAFLLVRFFTPLSGPPAVAPHIRVRITGLDALKLTVPGGTALNLGFNSKNNAVLLHNVITNALIDTTGGLTDFISGINPEPSKTPPVDSQDNGYGPVVGPNTGSNENVRSFPWASAVQPMTAAYPSPYGGEDTYPTYTNNCTPLEAVVPPSPVQIHNFSNGSSTYYGSQMSLTGGNITVEVLDDVNPVGTAQVLQSLPMTIPNMHNLPVPSVEMALNTSAEACGYGWNQTGTTGNAVGGPRIPGYYVGGSPPAMGSSSPAGPNGTPCPLNLTISESGGTSTFAPAPAASTPATRPSWKYYINPINYYWQLPYDCRSLADRLSGGGDSGRMISQGDVVRSLEVTPAGKVAGDMRLLAANPIQGGTSYPGDSGDMFVPLGSARSNSFYASLPTQGPWDNNPFIRQLHTLYNDANFGRGGFDLIPTSQAILTASPIGSLGNVGGGGGGMGEAFGALFPNEHYAANCAPVVTPELNGAFMDSGINTNPQIPGDWSGGSGDDSDGPFVLKPDEGAMDGSNGSGYAAYYQTDMIDLAFEYTNISFSPNRQVPSGIIFGGLPSRVMQGVPWCTLLFCPNPSANDDGDTVNLRHYGYGTPATSGALATTNQPAYYSPPYALPPDHLLLDLFWMPVVEPYAISEPFSTGGKVNMNYEIVPFGNYIHRSTALHAVLKSTRIMAIPTLANDADGTGWPGYTAATSLKPAGANWPSVKAIDGNSHSHPNMPNAYTYRYGINLPETIDDFATTAYTPSTLNGNAFYNRFIVQNDLFRSATEICNAFLVPAVVPGSVYYPTVDAQKAGLPADASYNAMKAWWTKFKLTGDNSREEPYNQIYPRLTTKSNTYDINMRVQVLTQTPADRASGTFNSAGGDSIAGEYRGSAIVERYLDPNQTSPAMPDFATQFPGSPTGLNSTVDPYVRYRVVSTHAFSP